VSGIATRSVYRLSNIGCSAFLTFCRVFDGRFHTIHPGGRDMGWREVGGVQNEGDRLKHFASSNGERLWQLFRGSQRRQKNNCGLRVKSMEPAMSDSEICRNGLFPLISEETIGLANHKSPFPGWPLPVNTSRDGEEGGQRPASRMVWRYVWLCKRT